MSNDTDKDQWSKIHEIREDFHRHETDCAHWRGATDQRLTNIERRLDKILWFLAAVFIAVLPVVFKEVVDFFGN